MTGHRSSGKNISPLWVNNRWRHFFENDDHDMMMGETKKRLGFVVGVCGRPLLVCLPIRLKTSTHVIG